MAMRTNVLTRLFYADQFDGERMKGLTIVDRSKKVNQIVVADSAMWNSAKIPGTFLTATFI